jgi:hypothetical protein
MSGSEIYWPRSISDRKKPEKGVNGRIGGTHLISVKEFVNHLSNRYDCDEGSFFRNRLKKGVFMTDGCLCEQLAGKDVKLSSVCIGHFWMFENMPEESFRKDVA